jgi:hypothetical protein
MKLTNLTSSSITTTIWGTPIFIEAKEVGESIEFLYRQISNCVTLQYPSPPPEERVFKIVYSCKKGKWHKSEPIYGKIIPAQEEYYEFD